MDYLEAFLSAEHAGEILIALGALLLFVGVLRIVRHGLTLAFWVLLCGVGAASLSYGMKRSSIDLPALPGASPTLAERVALGRDISADVLRVLCRRLEDYGGG